jgi:outer membrane protein assembly factor BamA
MSRRHAPFARSMGTAVALVFLFWPAPSRAEMSVAPGVFDGRPIVAIDLAGAGAPSRERFAALTQLRAGKRYSAAAIRRMIETLYRTEDYTDIRVDADPVTTGWR